MTFSLPGLILSLAILAPNVLLLAWPPHNPPRVPAKTGWLLSALEKGGQAACLVAPVLTGRDTGAAGWIDAWLVAVIVFVGAYYGLWARYVLRGRDFTLLYSPLAVLPVPMAVFPVVAFLAGAGWLHSWWLAGAAALLAAGHIPSALIIARQQRAAEITPQLPA